MQLIQFSSGRLVYGVLIICGFLTDILLMSFFGHYAPIRLIAVMLPSALFILGIFGLMRPRLVTLDAQSLTLRPTFGRHQRWTRPQIVNVEEIVSPPFAALIARVKDDSGSPAPSPSQAGLHWQDWAFVRKGARWGSCPPHGFRWFRRGSKTHSNPDHVDLSLILHGL